jgi:hypothetical protein
MLAGQGIAFDQLELWLLGKSLAQHGGQIAIDFNGDDASGPREKFFGQRPRSGPHFDCQIGRAERSALGDEADEIAIDHEILAEAMPRLGAGLGEKGLDVVLGLGHFFAC